MPHAPSYAFSSLSRSRGKCRFTKERETGFCQTAANTFILQQHQRQYIDRLEEPVYFCNMLIFSGIKIGHNLFLPDLILFPKNYGLFSNALCT